MSLRTRTSQLRRMLRPGVHSRIPIAWIPQPPENRTPLTWRPAKPARLAAALRVAYRATPAAGLLPVPVVM